MIAWLAIGGGCIPTSTHYSASGVPPGKTYVVIVVGSRARGGWVTQQLAESGLQVLMLEVGPPRVPTKDFTEHVWRYY